MAETRVSCLISLDDPLRHWRKSRKRDGILAMMFMCFASILSLFEILGHRAEPIWPVAGQKAKCFTTL